MRRGWGESAIVGMLQWLRFDKWLKSKVWQQKQIEYKK